MFCWITHRHASYSPPLHPSTYSRNSAPPFSHPDTWQLGFGTLGQELPLHYPLNGERAQAAELIPAPLEGRWQGQSNHPNFIHAKQKLARKPSWCYEVTALVSQRAASNCKQASTFHWALSWERPRRKARATRSAGTRTESPKLLQLHRGREYPTAQTMHGKGILLNAHTSAERNRVEFYTLIQKTAWPSS